MDKSVKQLLTVIFKDVNGVTTRYAVSDYRPINQQPAEVWFNCSSIEHDVLLRTITIKTDGGYTRVYFVQPPYMFTEK